MITVIGTGPTPVSGATRARIDRAALVVGAPRHLARVRAARTFELSGDLAAAFDAISSCEGDVVVLASGDPGFFGIVRTLAHRFGREAVEVVPGVSSVAAVFARAAVSWDDALVVSAHGRDERTAVNVCRAHPKVAVLTASGFGPAELAAQLKGLGRRFFVAERLGEQDERTFEGDAEEIAGRAWSDPNVVVVLDPEIPGEKSIVWPPCRAGRRWALPEDAFAHRGGMITKPEVRALALSRLGPGTGDLIWDVGAGSGSVGIECARFGAAVIAVERDREVCATIAANVRRHEVSLQIVHGEAPEALAPLPDPDAVFVGGTGGELEATLKHVAACVRRCVVVALASIERVGAAVEALETRGLDADAVLVEASRLRRIGDGHRLTPLNPVFLVSGVRA